jgi:hypothetical protein
MWRKMQGEEEPRVWEQGFKVCNTHREIDRMKLSTFLWFLMLFLFFFSIMLQHQLYSTPSFAA